MWVDRTRPCVSYISYSMMYCSTKSALSLKLCCSRVAFRICRHHDGDPRRRRCRSRQLTSAVGKEHVLMKEKSIPFYLKSLMQNSISFFMRRIFSVLHWVPDSSATSTCADLALYLQYTSCRAPFAKVLLEWAIRTAHPLRKTPRRWPTFDSTTSST